MDHINRKIKTEDVFTFEQIAEEYEGKYLKPQAGPIPIHQILVSSRNWNFSVEVVEGPYPRQYTRLTAPHFRTEEFLFTIYREGPLCKIGKLFGMQDIIVGYKEFDKDFIIKSTNKNKVKRLFKNKEIRKLLSDQKDFYFKNEQPGLAEKKALKIPDDLNFLIYQEGAVITDYVVLKNLIKLFTLHLEVMVDIGVVSETRPDFEVVERAFGRTILM